MIEKVIEDLDLKEKELQYFEFEDPFNTQNVLTGYISRRPDYRYGAVVFTQINGIDAYQICYGTPKQHYPFGRDGQFHFPSAERVEVYEKLDGTNVCAYQYIVGDETFQTYKLRLSPVLRNSRFGDFLEMWKEMLQKYPEIHKICETNDCNISFEMYGSRNIHLIAYETPLDIALLCGVGRDAEIYPPSTLETLGLPAAKLLSTIHSKQELVAEYKRFQAETESGNVTNEDETISGSEGTVWYVIGDGKTTQFKCKPESVEHIHWAWTNVAISANTIKATAHNVLETQDEITYEATVELLAEEFSTDDIMRVEESIRKVVRELREWYEFQKKVIHLYQQVGISIRDDKRTVMKEMSQHFPKDEMQKVFTAIIQQGN